MNENRVTVCPGARWRVAQCSLWFAFTSLAVFPSGLPAQALRLSSPAASPGSLVLINLSLTSQAGPGSKEPPSALQWEMTLPSRVMELPAENPAEARIAGKALSCREKSRNAGSVTYACLMFGGRKPLPDGVIAVLRIKIAANAPAKPVRVRIDQAIAVLKDATRIEMKPVETLVRIGRKRI